MPSTFHIPPAPMEGPFARLAQRLSRRLYGRVPDNLAVLWHHQPVLRATLAHEARVARWRELDPHLTTYAVMASAAQIGCSWCLDFGYFVAHGEGLDESKVREVPRWRTSDVFSDLEREVMAYAEAMTATPPHVEAAQVASLRRQLGNAAVVELTMVVALENERSRFNHAAGLASQGFSDVCELPLATP